MSDGFLEGARRPGYLALHGMLGEASDWEVLPDVSGLDLWAWDCGLDGVEIDAEVVVGYSMGGRLALHALDQVKAAVIVSAHTGLAAGQDARLEHDLRWAEKARTMAWAEFLAEWPAQEVFSGGGFEPDRSGLEPRREQIAAAFDRWSLGRQADLLPGLAEVTIPVLWVNGARDERFAQIGAAACEALPRGEHVIVEDCGHRVPWEAPEKFSDLIMQFLSRHSLCK
jgi:2-succinyl-6-hydroxy-2,4-cyclohexadiene-1-carboxylate synthase